MNHSSGGFYRQWCGFSSCYEQRFFSDCRSHHAARHAQTKMQGSEPRSHYAHMGTLLFFSHTYGKLLLRASKTSRWPNDSAWTEHRMNIICMNTMQCGVMRCAVMTTIRNVLAPLRGGMWLGKNQSSWWLTLNHQTTHALTNIHRWDILIKLHAWVVRRRRE